MNTRRKAAATGAKPTSNAPVKKPAPKASPDNAEPGPAQLPSKPAGRKRKQTTVAEETGDSTPDAATFAEFQAWQRAKTSEKRKSVAAEQKAAKAAKDKGGFLILLLSSSFLLPIY